MFTTVKRRDKGIPGLEAANRYETSYEGIIPANPNDQNSQYPNGQIPNKWWGIPKDN